MKNENELDGGKAVETSWEASSSNGTANNASLHLGDLLPSVQDGDLDVTEPSVLLDYSHFSKKEFTDLVRGLAQENDFKKVEAVLREIRPLYNNLRESERAAALERFKQKGGTPEDFEFKSDELDSMFDGTLKLIRDRKNLFFKNLEEQKSHNLRRKEEILEKLRAIVDSEDSENSFHHFKDLQHEWKGIGPVATAHVKTLWANYGALVDRFYDQRSIYFELKELDRKKNLEMKVELCERVVQLANVERIQDAIRELNDLHNEFKHIGPVPKEDKENLWQRFKAASDAVYARRDEYISKLQVELQENLGIKLTLGEELAPFATFQSEKIKEWNQKTQEILAIQKKWEGAGAIPRAKSKEINRKFWQAFKGFFNNKNLFFKKLDESRDKNLSLKNEIVRKAMELKDSQEWDKTANDFKELQRQWKEVGPVPEKFREKIFQEFKQACDHFFVQRRGQFEREDREQEENLKEKEAICAELERLTTEKCGSLDLLSELQNKFNALGFVPKKSIITIKNRFNGAVNKLLASLEISGDDKDRAMLEIQLSHLKNDPQADVKIYHKEQVIRKRITKMENDIALLRNNLEFFGRSKNAEKLKEEFNEKLREATEQLTHLKNQLKMLKTVSS